MLLSCAAETSKLPLEHNTAVKSEYLGSFYFKIPTDLSETYKNCTCEITKHNSFYYKVYSDCYKKDGSLEQFEDIVSTTTISKNIFASIPIGDNYFFAWVEKIDNNTLELSILADVDENDHWSPKDLRSYIKSRMVRGIPIAHKLLLHKR